MFWRTGAVHVLAWIACLTMVMCAGAAMAVAGSSSAALSFLAAAVMLAPVTLELVAGKRHKLAPAKVALFSTILLVPLGLGCLVVDSVAHMETAAKQRGFASAGLWGRAKDLNLPTPAALADHDAAVQKSALGQLCQQRAERPPLACFEPAHQRAALAYADVVLGNEEIEAVVRNAVAQQRKVYLAADKDCTDLLDRIDEDALPVMLENRQAALAVAAGMWARHLGRAELDQLVARAKSNVSYMSTTKSGLDQKLEVLTPGIEKELDSALQAWARHIVTTEPTWRAFLKGRTPLTRCKPAETP